MGPPTVPKAPKTCLVDNQFRATIPPEVRRILGIERGSLVTWKVEPDRSIRLQKVELHIKG